MTATTFDTLKFARALRDKAHFTNEQAEGMADAIAEVVQTDIATKGDVGSVRADINSLRISTRADLRETELHLEAKIEATKAEIIKWMFGTMGLQTIVIIGTVTALIRMLKP